MRLNLTNFSIVASLLLYAISTSPVRADETSLNLAIDKYLDGFRACNEANNLRSSDLAQAKANFNYYTQQLNKAIAIDESILLSTSREMATNLKYCKRVESNIQRAEATPILEQGIDYCKSSKAALSNNDLSLAAQEIQQYQQLKEQALIIAPDLMEVFVLASKIRTCSRVENKLKKEQAAAAQAEEEMKKAIIAYHDFKAQCEVARQFTSRAGFGVSQLLEANKLLNQAHKRKKNARQNTKAFELAEENPNSENAIALTTLVEESQLCESTVASAIRRATKTKRSQQKTLSNASKSLASALKECQTAQQQLKKPVTISELNRLKGLYNATTDVKDSITSNKALINISQIQQTWPQSKSLKQNLKSATSCLSIFAATLKATRPIPDTPVVIEEDAIEKTPANQAVTKSTAENKAQNNPQGNAQDNAEDPTEDNEDNFFEDDDSATSSTPSSDTVSETDNLSADEFDEFESDNPSQSHKSWTDIIR